MRTGSRICRMTIQKTATQKIIVMDCGLFTPFRIAEESSKIIAKKLQKNARTYEAKSVPTSKNTGPDGRWGPTQL